MTYYNANDGENQMKRKKKTYFDLFYDATAKSHDHSFEVLQKSKIGNFSVVTLRVATLVYYSPVIRSSPLLREWVLKTRRSKR